MGTPQGPQINTSAIAAFLRRSAASPQRQSRTPSDIRRPRHVQSASHARPEPRRFVRSASFQRPFRASARVGFWVGALSLSLWQRARRATPGRTQAVAQTPWTHPLARDRGGCTARGGRRVAPRMLRSHFGATSASQIFSPAGLPASQCARACASAEMLRRAAMVGPLARRCPPLAAPPALVPASLRRAAPMPPKHPIDEDRGDRCAEALPARRRIGEAALEQHTPVCQRVGCSCRARDGPPTCQAGSSL